MIHEAGFDDTFYYFGNERQIRDWPIVREFFFVQCWFLKQLEDFCLEHELALANTMFKQHPRRLYTWTSPDGNTRNQIDYISIAHRWKTSFMNCRTYPGADCDTDHQLLVFDNSSRFLFESRTDTQTEEVKVLYPQRK